MKSILYTLVCISAMSLCLKNDLHAQYYEKDTTYQDFSAQLIYVDINPLIAFGINADLENMEWRVGYKYQRDEARRYKVALGYFREEIPNESFYWGTFDSLSLWRSNYSLTKTGRLFLGMEWGKYNRVISPYYGVDLMLGWTSSRSAYGWEIYGTSEYAVVIPEIGADSLYLTVSNLRDGYIQLVDLIESNSLELGLALKVGMRVQIAKHWEGFVELSPSINYSHIVRSYNITEGREIGLLQRSFYDFRFQLLNFALAYKF